MFGRAHTPTKQAKQSITKSYIMRNGLHWNVTMYLL